MADETTVVSENVNQASKHAFRYSINQSKLELIK